MGQFADLSLHTKKLVYSSGLPLPMAVYDGMVETVYMIANSVAFTSVCTPGLYKVMRDFFFGIEHDGRRVIIDDILGMTATKEDDVYRPVWTMRFIEQLAAMNRILWTCPHREHTGDIEVSSPGVYWSATPLAFLHERRLSSVNVGSINRCKDSWFIIPAGTGHKVSTAVTFYLTFIKRPLYVARIPSAKIDDTFIVIPPKGVDVLPVVRGVHVHAPSRPMPLAGVLGDDDEAKLYRYLYG